MNNYFTPNPQNYYGYNPINPNDQLWYGIGFPVEIFYKIDFYNIKKDTYLISSYGRIFSLNTGREMTPIANEHEYRSIQLAMEEGYGNQFNRRVFKIHRLVAMAFIIKTIEDYQLGRDIVNHKNLYRTDNHVWNLEWMTEQDNTIHAFQNNAHQMANLPSLFKQVEKQESQWGKGIAKGDRNGKSRLTEEQVHLICQGLEKGLSPKECCHMAGIEWNDANSSLINNIKGGRRRQDIASQYNINPAARPQFDYGLIEPKIYELLNQGYSVKQIYEQIKNIIPYHDGEDDTKHYNRVRIKIGNMRKKFMR